MQGWKNILNPGVWRLLPGNPLLGLPVLIALIAGGIIDWGLRPLSTVRLGDNGAILFGRFIISMFDVVIPDLIWSTALVLTAVLAMKILNNDYVEPTPERLQAFAQDTVFSSWPFIAALTAIQVLLSVILPFAGVLAILLAAIIIFGCAFALPAYVISGVPTLEAFRASASFAQQRPLKVVLSLVLPLEILLAVGVGNIFINCIPVVGIVLTELLMCIAVTYSVLHVVAIYHRSSYEFHVTQDQELLSRALYSNQPTKND